MSFWSSLVTWANVPFVIALGIAVTFALLQASGLIDLLAGDSDGDGGGDGADSDGDADGDTDSDGDGDEHAGFGAGVLAYFGVGTVPTSIIWQSFFVAFAVTGLALNAVSLARSGPVPAHSLLWTAPLAALVALAVTRGIARALRRIMPAAGGDAGTRGELVGRAGVVISTRVSTEFGEVRLRDKSGQVVRVIVRAHEGEIAEGREIVVVDHDEAAGVLYVAPLEDTATPP